MGRISSTSLGYAMSEQPDGLPQTFWQMSGSAQATCSAEGTRPRGECTDAWVRVVSSPGRGDGTGPGPRTAVAVEQKQRPPDSGFA